MTFKKTCGRCEKELKEGQDVYCDGCEKFRLEIRDFYCKECNKHHKRTESLDKWYKELCRKCFYERFNSYKPPSKVKDDLKKFRNNYIKKHGQPVIK